MRLSMGGPPYRPGAGIFPAGFTVSLGGGGGGRGRKKNILEMKRRTEGAAGCGEALEETRVVAGNGAIATKLLLCAARLADGDAIAGRVWRVGKMEVSGETR